MGNAYGADEGEPVEEGKAESPECVALTTSCEEEGEETRRHLPAISGKQRQHIEAYQIVNKKTEKA